MLRGPSRRPTWTPLDCTRRSRRRRRRVWPSSPPRNWRTSPGPSRRDSERAPPAYPTPTRRTTSPARKPRARCSRPGARSASCASPTATLKLKSWRTPSGPSRPPASRPRTNSGIRLQEPPCRSCATPSRRRRRTSRTVCGPTLKVETARPPSGRNYFRSSRTPRQSASTSSTPRSWATRPGRTRRRPSRLQNCSTPSRRAPRAASSASSPRTWPIRLGPSRRRRTGRLVYWMPSRAKRRGARTNLNLKNWRTRPGPSPPVAEMTLLTPKYKGSSSTTSRARPINDWTASPIKGYRILLGRSPPPARPNGTRNSSAPSRAKRRRAWPSSSPRASRI
mmetsp:Transcript_11661/g.34687  ORF Transcript_11661/g.34687 Transcript_11661/m.34687 type:complete len:336 (+) Transcript_11661:633-1640(+)